MAGSIGASVAAQLPRHCKSRSSPHTFLSEPNMPGKRSGSTSAVLPPEAGKAGDPMATIVIIGLVIFFSGAVVGGILLVSWGIRREERDFSLTRRAPGLASQGARQVTGLWVRRRTDLDPALERQPEMLV
jgi:hypothetical protein